jgi:protein FAM32A
MNLSIFRLATLASYPVLRLFSSGGRSDLPTNPNNERIELDKTGDEGNPHPDYDHLTPAERCYMEQKHKIDMQKMAKVANKSHRDRIQDFNQYLANLSEHYDIPKVGPS